MSTFSYSSGNPDNLTGGHAASMQDIKGPFIDIVTFLNGNISDINLATSVKPVTILAPYRTIQQERTSSGAPARSARTSSSTISRPSRARRMRSAPA